MVINQQKKSYIDKIRTQYPQYKDIDDETLAKAYREVHYSDMDENEFLSKVGFEKSQKEKYDDGEIKYKDTTPDSWIDKIGNDLGTIGDGIATVTAKVSDYFGTDEQPTTQIQPTIETKKTKHRDTTPDNWGDKITKDFNTLNDKYVNPLLYGTGEDVQVEDLDIGNTIAGVGKRTADLGAGLVGTTDAIANSLEDDNNGGVFLKDVENALKGLDTGYQEVHSWDKVKNITKKEGLLSGDTWEQIGKYALEQGVKSVPDMASVMLNLPAYIYARSGEMADDRARNNNQKESTLKDVAIALPFATGSAILERIGVKGMTSDVVEQIGKEALQNGLLDGVKQVAKQSVKAGGKEAGTEFLQEGGIEYAGETLGTDKPMSFDEGFDRGLAGAVAGGGMGTTIGGGVATYKEAMKPKTFADLLGNELNNNIENSNINLEELDKNTRELFNPNNAQYRQESNPLDEVQKGFEELQTELYGNGETTQDELKPKGYNDEQVSTDIDKAIKERAETIATLENFTGENPTQSIDTGVAGSIEEGTSKIDDKLQSFNNNDVQSNTTPITEEESEISKFNKAQIKRAMKEYPNAGITTNDTADTVKTKILANNVQPNTTPLETKEEPQINSISNAIKQTVIADGLSFDDTFNIYKNAHQNISEQGFEYWYSNNKANLIKKLPQIKEDIKLSDIGELQHKDTIANLEYQRRNNKFGGKEVDDKISQNLEYIQSDDFKKVIRDYEENTEVMFKPLGAKRNIKGTLIDLPHGFKGVVAWDKNGKDGRIYEHSTGSLVSNVRKNDTIGKIAQAHFKMRDNIDKIKESQKNVSTINPTIEYVKVKKETNPNEPKKGQVAFEFMNGFDIEEKHGYPISFDNDINGFVFQDTDGTWTAVEKESGSGLSLRNKTKTSAIEKANEEIGKINIDKLKENIRKNALFKEKQKFKTDALDSFFDLEEEVKLNVFRDIYKASNLDDATLMDELSMTFDETTKGAITEKYIANNNSFDNYKKSSTIKEDNKGVEDDTSTSTKRDTRQTVSSLSDGSSGGKLGEPQQGTIQGASEQSTTDGTREVQTKPNETSNQNDGRDDTIGVSTPRSEKRGDEGTYTENSLNDDNFVIEDELGEGGAKTKFHKNIEAIQIVHKIQKDGYTPTVEDKKALAQYIGWGGLSNAFYKPDGSVAKGWEKEAKILKDLLSNEAYNEARRSTQDAHYTPKEVVNAIWKAVENFGFRGGKVLEPSVGVGNFFGLMPTKYKSTTKLLGVELDSTTATIAKALYPKANIVNKGFQDVVLEDGSFSLVIGNPPFGSQSIYDKNKKEISDFNIHNYFFAKSMDALQEGGILAMVVSNGLLDSSNTKAREYLGKQANLIGAIRLPNNAFSKNANTEVTTDIIFLQKRYEGQESNINEWKDIGELNDTPLNSYFENNQNNLLGKWGKYGTMYRGDSPALIVDETKPSMYNLMSSAITELPQNIITYTQKEKFDNSNIKENEMPKVRIGAMFVHSDGFIYQRNNDKDGSWQFEKVESKTNSSDEEVALTPKEISRIKGMIEVVVVADKLRDLQVNEYSTESELNKTRKELNTAYDSFVKAHGYLNSQTNKSLFETDIRSPFLLALEKNHTKAISKETAKKTGQIARSESAEKADIFYKRTQTPYKRPTKADNSLDALTISLSEYGNINLDYIQELTGKSEEAITKELDGFIFEDVNSGWVTREEFLSGDVKQKYKEATNPKYKELLKTVIPKDIDAVDISVSFGAGWIPKEDMAEFVQEITGDTTPHITYTSFNAKWNIEADSTTSSKSKWGTNRRSVADILTATANLQIMEVKDNIGTSKEPQWILNTDETTAVQEKQELIKEAFKEWIWKSSDRRDRIGKLYNDKFNNKALRNYDGTHLGFVGKSNHINLRQHQKNGVWRVLQGGTVLFDHTVGTGKTFTAIASAMELRRTGKAKKPLIVVPNHLTGQWGKEWMEIYPSANILVPTERDFSAKRRKLLMSRIATGDYDGIIIGHSQLTMIQNDLNFESEFIKEEIDRIQQAIDMLRAEDGKDSRSVKNAEKSKERLTEKLEKLNDIKRDDNLDFSQLGVDAIIVDEAHEFKNLTYVTGLQKVAGLGNPAGSKKAFDLFIKTQNILEKTGGNNVVFLTGTPISNTIAEMFTMQRYLNYNELKADGIDIFDAWVKQNAEIVSDWELSPSGKYKLNTRLSKFKNMPELITSYKMFADVVTREDIPSLPIPKIKTGRPQNIVVERSEDQANYIGVEDKNGRYPEGSLVYRSENLPKGKPKKGDDNMLSIMGEARKVALDMRLINPSFGDNPDSKVNLTVKNTVEIYKKWNDKKGTQLIFCDLSTPKGARAKLKAELEALIKKADEGDEKAQEKLDKMSPDEIDALNSEFSVYDDIKAKLIAKGIPENEIAFIHDANTKIQKQELFDKVKSGRVRVLLGSTSKMGAGMNVQDKLVALHHIDVPWRPSDLEQREGRIIRQGNEFFEADPKNFEVDIFRYATKNTLDSMMWQTIEAKAKFIEQLRAGNLLDREVEDVSGEAVSAGEMKALSSGNPLILEDMKLRKDIKKLTSLKQNHDRTQFDIEDKINRINSFLKNAPKELETIQKDIELSQKLPEKFNININGKVYEDREEAGKEMIYLISQQKNHTPTKIGMYGEFEIYAENTTANGLSKALYGTIEIVGNNSYTISIELDKQSYSGLTLKINNVLKGLPKDYTDIQENMEYHKEELPKLKEQIGSFKQEEELQTLKERQKEVLNLLKKKDDDKDTDTNKEAEPEEFNSETIQNKISENNGFKKFIEVAKKTKDKLLKYKIEDIVGIEKRELGEMFDFKKIENLKRVINNYQIRHILNQHGDEAKETSRGNIFITEEHILNYKNIIHTSDLKIFSKNKNGTPTIVYGKQLDNESYVIVEEIRTGKNELSLHTMRITKGKLTEGGLMLSKDKPQPLHPKMNTSIDGSISNEEIESQENEILASQGVDNKGKNFIYNFRDSKDGFPQRPTSGTITLRGKDIELQTYEAPQTVESVREFLKDIIGNRLYDGRVKGASRLGTYNRVNTSVRVKNYHDIEVQAHEMAHFLDYFYQNKTKKANDSYFKTFKNKHKDFLKSVSYTNAKALAIPEGFAEFVRLYTTQYNKLLTINGASDVVKDFEEVISKDKTLQNKIHTYQEEAHKYYFQGSIERLSASSDSSLSKEAQKVKNKGVVWKTILEKKQQFVDKNLSIKIIEEKLKGKEPTDALHNTYKLFNLVNGAEGTVDMAIEYGVPFVDANGDIGLDESKNPLDKIFKPLFDKGFSEVKLFENYAKSRRGAELKEQGRENRLDWQVIEAGLKLEQTHPHFKDIFAEYQEFNDAMLDFYVGMKLITKEQKKSFKEANSEYVPFHRVKESIAQGKTITNVANSKINARLTGGTGTIGNVMDNIYGSIEKNIKDAYIARAKTSLYSMLSKDGGEFAVKVGRDSKLVKAEINSQAKTIATVLIELGMSVSKDGMIVQKGDIHEDVIVDTDEITTVLENNPQLLEMWSIGHIPKSNDKMIDSAIIDGSRVYFEINDPMLIDTLRSQKGLYIENQLLKFGIGYKNISTFMITNNPLFYLTNALRDTVSASVMSENGFIPFYHTIKGMYHFVSKDKMYKNFMVSGGGYSTRATALGRFDDINTNKGNVARHFGAFEKVATFLAYGADMFEYGTRIGEFELAVNSGKSNLEAGSSGREISTDFSKNGSGENFRKFLGTVAFAKAGINSIDRFYRRFRDTKTKTDKTRLLMMGGAIATFTIALALMNEDDDRYKALTKDQKSMYWWIYLDNFIDKDTLKTMGINPIWKLPKPYDIGILFANVPEMMFEFVKGNSTGTELRDRFIFDMYRSGALMDFPSVIKGGLEVAVNEDWRGIPIESLGMQFQPKELRAKSNTPEIYKSMGNKVLSPAQIHHLSNSFLGLYGRMLDDAMEVALWDDSKNGERVFAKSNPLDYLTSRVQGREVENRTKYDDLFYKQYKDIVENYGEYKNYKDEKNAEAMREFRKDKEKMEKYNLKSYADGINKKISMMKKSIEKIKLKNTTADKKEKEIERIIKLKNKTAKDAVEKFSRGK